MKLVIATRNQSKAREMKDILAQYLKKEFVIQSLTEYPEFEEPEENGSTYIENASIKARTASYQIGELCIADDAGLEIDALDGQPGLHSKRFAGESTSFDEKIAQILSKLEGSTCRKARFKCAVSVANPNGETTSFESVCEGKITTKPIGEGGFGYDSIFLYPPAGMTFAQMPQEEKNKVSHRGIILKQVANWLNKLESKATN